jgi:zinc transporter ZupT
VTVALLCVAWSRPGGANFGPGGFGEPAGDPIAAEWFAHLEVLHEALAIDLRPIAEGGPALVSVRYRVRALRDIAPADFIFASPGIERGSVVLDGAAVAAELIEDWEPPEDWAVGEQVPTIGGGEHLMRFDRRPHYWDGNRYGVLRFAAPLAAGEYDLSVHYEVRPRLFQGSGYYAQRDVAYLLAPARMWASFGTLEVRVDLPDGWEAVSTPRLARQGDRLEGSFDGLPADAIIVGIRKPTPLWWYAGRGLPFLVLGLGLAGAVLAGRRVALAAPESPSLWPAWVAVPASIVVGLVYGLASLLAALLVEFLAPALEIWGPDATYSFAPWAGLGRWLIPLCVGGALVSYLVSRLLARRASRAAHGEPAERTGDARPGPAHDRSGSSPPGRAADRSWLALGGGIGAFTLALVVVVLATWFLMLVRQAWIAVLPVLGVASVTLGLLLARRVRRQPDVAGAGRLAAHALVAAAGLCSGLPLLTTVLGFWLSPGLLGVALLAAVLLLLAALVVVAVTALWSRVGRSPSRAPEP